MKLPEISCRYFLALTGFLKLLIIGPFIRGKIRRELYHLYEHVLSNKTRLISDEMCRLYGKFASHFVLCKTRLIFPRINGLNMTIMLSISITSQVTLLVMLNLYHLESIRRHFAFIVNIRCIRNNFLNF